MIRDTGPRIKAALIIAAVVVSVIIANLIANLVSGDGDDMAAGLLALVLVPVVMFPLILIVLALGDNLTRGAPGARPPSTLRKVILVAAAVVWAAATIGILAVQR